ncbi:MAG: glycosyltransferase, partial [Actinomycetales bacterium]|nr:glycosyltransferase [Actinomycetales bacterium]
MMDSDYASLGQILVIVPTYNELESLPVLIAGLRRNLPTVSILVVDDNSPDGTGHLADEISSADDQVFVLHRTQKNGLGAAYLAGFAWAKENGFDVAVEMDADGSHRVADLPKLLTALTNADAVL